MILIADSGSTKTHWGLVDENSASPALEFQTSGINPFYQDRNSILHMLQKEFTWKINTPFVCFFMEPDVRVLIQKPLFMIR